MARGIKTMKRSRLLRPRAIRHRVGGPGYAQFSGEFPLKPKGMHWRTYEKEIARIEAFEKQCNLALWQCVARMLKQKFVTDFD
jgi:hypothetical protein